MSACRGQPGQDRRIPARVVILILILVLLLLVLGTALLKEGEPAGDYGIAALLGIVVRLLTTEVRRLTEPLQVTPRR